MRLFHRPEWICDQFFYCKLSSGSILLLMIGVNCLEKKSLNSFAFSLHFKINVLLTKRWYFGGSTFIHYSINNLPIRCLRSARVIHFIS